MRTLPYGVVCGLCPPEMWIFFKSKMFKLNTKKVGMIGSDQVSINELKKELADIIKDIKKVHKPSKDQSIFLDSKSLKTRVDEVNALNGAFGLCYPELKIEYVEDPNRLSDFLKIAGMATINWVGPVVLVMFSGSWVLVPVALFQLWEVFQFDKQLQYNDDTMPERFLERMEAEAGSFRELLLTSIPTGPSILVAVTLIEFLGVLINLIEGIKTPKIFTKIGDFIKKIIDLFLK